MKLDKSDLLIKLSEQFILQQKLVRKIEVIMRSQNLDLLTPDQLKFRLNILKMEKQNLNVVKSRFYEVLDTTPLPEESE